MKKIFFMIVFAVMCFTCSAVYAERPVKIISGGEFIKTDVAPVIINDRTMVPVRAIFENIGAKVDYDGKLRKVTAVKNNRIVELIIDSDVITINGNPQKIDSPAIIKNDRTLVPLRACAEAFGLEVEWIESARTVKIKKEVYLPQYILCHDGSKEEFFYDNDNNLIKHIVSDGTVITYNYNNLGQITFYGAGDDYYEIYKYNDFGEKIYFEDSYGYKVFTHYDDNGNIITEESDYTKTKFEYDQNGNIIYKEQSYSENGELSFTYWEKNKYNEAGKIEQTATSNGDIIDYTYDNAGRLVYKSSTNGSYIKTEYDIYGNAVYIEEREYYLGEYYDKVITYSYDEQGLLIKEKQADGIEVEYTYDENGNILSITSNDGTFVKYTYDSEGRCILEDGGDGNKTEILYNSDDNSAVTQNSLGIMYSVKQFK